MFNGAQLEVVGVCDEDASILWLSRGIWESASGTKGKCTNFLINGLRRNKLLFPSTNRERCTIVVRTLKHINQTSPTYTEAPLELKIASNPRLFWRKQWKSWNKIPYAHKRQLVLVALVNRKPGCCATNVHQLAPQGLLQGNKHFGCEIKPNAIQFASGFQVIDLGINARLSKLIKSRSVFQPPAKQRPQFHDWRSLTSSID